MARSYGSQSMVEPLTRVGVHRPGECFGSADPGVWHYTSRPDLSAAQDEHDRLAALLEEAGAEVVRLAGYTPEEKFEIVAQMLADTRELIGLWQLWGATGVS